MAQPTEYERQADFSEYQAANPQGPILGVQVDLEFDAVKLTLDEIMANLVLIQRDDGALANGIVTPDSLSTATLTLIGGFNPTGAWVTATAYEANDVVTNTGSTRQT